MTWLDLVFRVTLEKLGNAVYPRQSRLLEPQIWRRTAGVELPPSPEAKWGGRVP